jgi:hypothetical protein
MADDKNPKAQGQTHEDAIVSRLKGEGQTPTGVTSFIGLLGRSSRQGYWVLYLSMDMSRSVEIQETDIVYTETLPSDRSPFGGLGGTRVFVKQDAQVTRTQTLSQTKDASEAAADEFDLDIRLGVAGPTAVLPIPTRTCPDGTVCRTCDGTCDTCLRQQTCRTCLTDCNQATCANTCPNTCQTCNTNCGQATCANTCPKTCQTCNTNCGQATCGQHTCATCLGQETCRTCFCTDTCHKPCF